MKRSVVDKLLWEENVLENYNVYSGEEIEQENLNDIPVNLISSIRVCRDENYNLKVTCKRDRSQNTEKEVEWKRANDNLELGEFINPGTLKIHVYESYNIELTPCIYRGDSFSEEKVEYYLDCYHIEGCDSSKETMVLKEWFINGSNNTTFIILGNEKYEYEISQVIKGTWGSLEFENDDKLNQISHYGRFAHIKYKDTAFDIDLVGAGYGPDWSNNISITYNQKYGRIPSEEERGIIHDYLSFIIGKRLIYIGESSYDGQGNKIGFVMEAPNNLGFDIRELCSKSPTPPIQHTYRNVKDFITIIEKQLDSFEEIYNKLNLKSFFLSYWYAKGILKPYDLPILAGALEELIRQWYKNIEKNKDTVLIKKAEFNKRIKPVKELVIEQFKDTGYEQRMLDSIGNINRMSVTERFENFFIGINMPVGKEERKAMAARNRPAHGNISYDIDSYKNQILQSEIYDRIIARIILCLINYDGEYIDYGMVGYPQKNIKVPSGKE